MIVHLLSVLSIWDLLNRFSTISRLSHSSINNHTIEEIIEWNWTRISEKSQISPTWWLQCDATQHEKWSENNFSLHNKKLQFKICVPRVRIIVMISNKQIGNTCYYWSHKLLYEVKWLNLDILEHPLESRIDLLTRFHSWKFLTRLIDFLIFFFVRSNFLVRSIKTIIQWHRRFKFQRCRTSHAKIKYEISLLLDHRSHVVLSMKIKCLKQLPNWSAERAIFHFHKLTSRMSDDEEWKHSKKYNKRWTYF